MHKGGIRQVGNNFNSAIVRRRLKQKNGLHKMRRACGFSVSRAGWVSYPACVFPSPFPAGESSLQGAAAVLAVNRLYLFKGAVTPVQR